MGWAGEKYPVSPMELTMKQTFEAWLALVDAKLIRDVGMDHATLPDMPWRDWFDDNMSATEAAQFAVDVARDS